MTRFWKTAVNLNDISVEKMIMLKVSWIKKTNKKEKCSLVTFIHSFKDRLILKQFWICVRKRLCFTKLFKNMFPSYFPMDTIKRCLVSVVFVVNCVTFALICTAMLTQEWTVVKPVRIGLNISLRHTEPLDPETNRFQGVINFGLFDGKKVLNYGFGNRVFDLKSKCSSFNL